jgi:hypothetical protein
MGKAQGGESVTDNVITLPVVRVERDGETDQQWNTRLLALHERLSEALMKERKQIDNIRMVLSIDDVMMLCQAIEDKLGPEWFSEE